MGGIKLDFSKTFLALLINDIVGSKSVHLPAIANQMADSTKTESRLINAVAVKNNFDGIEWQT